MSARLPNLTWLRTFEAAARLLNFTATGAELGLTQTAVSLHIKALEETLGCKLFLRKPRNLELTEMGKAYSLAVRKGIGDINLATVSLFGTDKKRTITVRAPISTATFWLAPRLPTFLKDFPDINVRMVSTIWASSVADEDVDVDLRIGFGDWPDVSSERISTEMIVPIASKGRALQMTRCQDLAAGSLIQVLGYEDHWERYFEANGIDPRETGTRYSVDTTAAALALVAASGGYAVILQRFADEAIRAGQQISIVGKPITFPQSHFLTTTATDTATRPEVGLFKDWLRSSFDAHHEAEA